MSDGAVEHKVAPLKVMYVAPAFPVRSETFVSREVVALRARGDEVPVAGLREPPERLGGQGGTGEMADVTTVYGRGCAGAVLREVGAHPLRSVGTFATALADAVAPGEPMGWKERIKLLAQAAGGLVVAGRARRRDIRHVHAHFAHAPAAVAMYAARQLGGSFSFTGHANDIFHRRSLLKRKLQRAAFVSCISHWHRAFYEQVWPGAAEKGVIVRCGVPVGRVIERVLPVEGELRLLVVARLVPKKGIDVLLRALAGLPRARLTIAGDGPQRGELERLARELGVEERVVFLGPVDSERVPGLLAEADLFVLPCQPDSAGDRDGIPVVLMEAMAAGVPVVSGDLPAIRELVESGVSGELVPPGQVTPLVDILTQLADDPTRRARLAAGGLSRVQSEFGQPLNIQRLRAAFSERTVQYGPACATPTDPTASSPPAGMRPSSAGGPSIPCSPRRAVRT